MSRRAGTLRSLLVVLCLAVGSAHAAKGYVVTEDVQLPDGTQTRRVTYLSERAQRTEDATRVTLLALRAADLKLYQIDDKTRTVRDASTLAPMMLMTYAVFLDRDAGGKARIRQDFATPTDETRPIGKWLARKVVTKPLGLTTYGWYTKDSPDMIGADRMRTKFFTAASESFLKPNLGSAASVEEMTAINSLVVDFTERMIRDYGAPVMTQVGLGDGRMAETRVVAVESRDLPDSVFELPTGYALEDDLAPGK